MDGIALAAKYSFITNKLKYCGPDGSYRRFLEYIKTKDKKILEEIKDQITRFEGLYPYLRSIAKKSRLDIFDHKVVEAYWLGNELLDGFDENELKETVMALSKRGLPATYAKKLCENIPSMVPHHSFNVIYVGVGKVTGSVEFNIENINNCLIRPAEVLGVGEKIRVRHRQYVFEKGMLKLSDNTVEDFDWQPEFTLLNVGDVASIHWRFVVDRLDDRQHSNLLKYTFRNIQALNESRLI